MVNVRGNVILRKLSNNGITCFRQRKWASGLSDVIFSDILHSFSPELISPEGSHHKPCLSGQIYSRKKKLPFETVQSKWRNPFDIVKRIYSVLSTQRLNPPQYGAQLKHQFGVTTSHTWLLKGEQSLNLPSLLPGKTSQECHERYCSSNTTYSLFSSAVWLILTGCITTRKS